MKKLIALMVLLAMAVTLCSCVPEAEPAPFDRNKAISPDGVPAKMPDGLDNYDVTRIHTGNCDEAGRLLDHAYKALENLGITANVESIYETSLGLAAGDFSFDPHIIDTDDSEIDKDPVVMIVLNNADGYCVLVSQFRLSKAGNDLQNHCCETFEACGQKVLKDAGLTAEDIAVNFTPQELTGLTLKAVSEEYRELYDEAFERYLNTVTGCWDSDPNDYIRVNNIPYYRVLNPGINSLADVKTYLEEYFTARVADYIMSAVAPFIYVEANGHLYYTGVGVGEAIDIEDIRPRYVAETDTRLYMIVELVRLEMDDHWEFTGGRTYYENLFVFNREDGKWKCNRFHDIVFDFC